MNESNYFIVNRETGKLELHFEKSVYSALTDEQKADIKSNFLWGRNSGCWISRCKEPNLHWARCCAERIGLADAGETGERLSFAEQMERKQERAERRAERYDARADAAEKRGEQLQAPIEKMHGDIAFFTQPIVNTSAGRAFGRRREKMFAAWERGFDEFRKSEYWQERAETARRTAAGKELTDKGFIQRRINECEANLRALRRSYDAQERTVTRLEAGEELKNYAGETISLDKARENLEYWLDRIEVELDKLGYYQDALDALGGVEFSRKNLKKGDMIVIQRYGLVRVVRCGPKNVTYEHTIKSLTYADGTPMQGQASYAEIIRRAGEPETITPDEFAASLTE